MYNVLLVDDERIILEGIAAVVDWEGCGTRLVGKAAGGAEAFVMVKALQPHIVITDMKMPEMDGVELIRRMRDSCPDVQVIVLSGHEDFEYAQQAMQYGVRHYLLKPCNEGDIHAALTETAGELRAREQEAAFLRQMHYNLERVTPRLKEQFLKDCLTNKTYGEKEWEFYGRLFNLQIGREPVRLFVFEVEGEYEFEHAFALGNIAAELFGTQGHAVHLSTTIGERVVILADQGEMEEWLDVLREVKRTYRQFYKLDFTAAVSEAGVLQQMRHRYSEALGYLACRFYLGDGSIITKREAGPGSEPAGEPDFPFEEIGILLRSGHVNGVREKLLGLFGKLRRSPSRIHAIKSLLMELYLNIVRHAPEPKQESAIRELLAFERFETLDPMCDFVLEAAVQAAQARYDSNLRLHSDIVRRMVHYVEDHLDDETLTLTSLAREVFFMNADYLGKLFRGETGMKFSVHVMNARMNMAIALLEAGESDRVADLAERVGFGNNPQYFSQVFKKHTGYTPTEYRKRVSSEPVRAESP